jgi:hypothetical protein
MTYNELVKEVTKREGKKKSLPIAQVREVLTILSDMCAESLLSPIDVMSALVLNGCNRAKKSKK